MKLAESGETSEIFNSLDTTNVMIDDVSFKVIGGLINVRCLYGTIYFYFIDRRIYMVLTYFKVKHNHKFFIM